MARTGSPTPNESVERSTKDLVRAAMSGWLGTALEYVDFQLYSLAAALVFQQLFFPEAAPGTALIAAMATYGVGFAARPVGALIFGRMGDKVGRKQVLFITIAMMGAATTLIGLLPTHDRIGILAPILLVTLRIVQGLGAGAEIAGATTILAEYAPMGRRGIIASLVSLGTNSGTLLATGLWTVLLTVLTEEQLLAWGWRLPFLASFLIMLFAVWIRVRMKESPVFEAREDVVDGQALTRTELEQEARSTRSSSTSTVEVALRQRKGKAFILAMLLRMGESGNSGIIQTYLIGFLTTYVAVEKSIGTQAILIGSVIGFVTVPFFGALSDRIGRRPAYLGLSIFQVLFAVPLMLMVTTANPVLITVAIIVGLDLTILGMFATQSSYLPELFGARTRYTQLALSKEFGGILAAGIAPFILAAAVAAAGHWWPVAAAMIFYSGLSLVGASIAPETRDRDLTALNDAV